MRNSKSLSLLAIAYLILGLAILFGLGQINWVRYHELAQHGAPTMAEVLRVEPNNHNSLFYAYEVAGVTHDGVGSISGVEKPGAKIGIFYSPNNPAYSCYGEPKDLLRNETISIVLPALFVPVVILMAFFQWRSRKRR